MKKIHKEYLKLVSDLITYDNDTIPLCAAQTHISEFCKQPLMSNFEGKYSFLESNGENSFIGGEFLEKLNDLLSEQCKLVFNTDYINADTMTGINCFTVCAMALLNNNSKVLVTTPEQGGHSSIPVILRHLGVEYESIPYDFSKYQIDYTKTNELLKTNEYSFIILCQSDLLQVPDLDLLKLGDVGIIYDATQTLGLIAGQAILNPLFSENVILIGGTHKTLPAPACGMIMTNNQNYITNLKKQITPELLRNTQPNHIAGLLLSLIEQQEYGQIYQKKVVEIANTLGEHLQQKGFALAKVNEKTFTNTHQLFILLNEEETNQYYINAKLYNITLNKKHKQLFGNSGIRIGTQQIARYNWAEDEISSLARLLFCLKTPDICHDEILEIRKELIAKKIPHFEYDEISIK